MKLEIQKDGLTYIITASMEFETRQIVALLQEDQEGWLLWDGIGLRWSHRIGRRKTWQKALHDALVYIEDMLKG